MEFLKAPFWVLHFSSNTLMTFLTMLYVILLFMLMILLSIISVIRHLICGNNLNWFLKLYLIQKTLWSVGKKWVVDFKAGKTQLVLFDRSNNVSIDVKMDGSVLKEKLSFKMLELTFSSKLDWGSCIISIAKMASKKIGALIRSILTVHKNLKICKIKNILTFIYICQFCIFFNILHCCSQYSTFSYGLE